MMPVRTSSIVGGVLSGFATRPIARWGAWPQCCLRPSAPTTLINDYSLYLLEVEKSGEDRAVDFPVFAVYFGEGEAQVLMNEGDDAPPIPVQDVESLGYAIFLSTSYSY
jgi:hypothetical protein